MKLKLYKLNQVFGTIDISNPEVKSMKKIVVKLSNERLITPSGLKRAPCTWLQQHLAPYVHGSVPPAG